jgi:cytochrome c oxidase cbb3-type subunit 3
MSDQPEIYSPENEPFQRDQVMEGHTYDGIQEYENPLPFWWIALFGISILFAIVYFIGSFVTGSIDSYEEDLAQGMEEIQQMREAAASQAPSFDAAALAAMSSDPANVEAGNLTFQTYCAICHGANGEGGIGPNLTDAYWIYGGDHEAIYSVITNGAQNGMVAWESVITADDRAKLVAFIDSIVGTEPENAKEPQGELWEAPATNDETGDNPEDESVEMEENEAEISE